MRLGTPPLTLSAIHDLKHTLRRKSERTGEIGKSFTRLKARTDHFVSFLRLSARENAAELKQPLQNVLS